MMPIVLLAIFLISLFPATMAQQEGNQPDAKGDAETEPNIPELRNSPTAIANRPAPVTAQLKEKLQDRLANIPEPARIRWEETNQKRLENIAKLEELKAKPAFNKFKQELNFKVREINAEKLNLAKQNLGQAVKNFAQAREKSREAHKEFLAAKNEFKACTGTCEEIESQLLQHSKRFLINTVDSMIKHLEKIKNTVQSNEDLTEEEASEMITKIDAQIQELENAKAKVELATTKEEIRESTKTINQAWKRIKEHAKWYVGKVAISKHGGIIVKLKHLEPRLQKVLEKMEENGKDTSTIQPLIDEFNTHMEEARKNFELATAKFKEFKGLPEPKGESGSKIIQEAQDYMKQSKDRLKEAFQTLKEITKAIKDANGEDELEETTTEEALEETEDENDEEETETD